MNCEQRRDLMPLLLVDALEPAEAAALRAHRATGCTRCASYLAVADATLAYLPFALDQTAPAPSARDRLFNQLNQAPPSRPDTTPARRHILKLPHWVRASLPAAIAASIVFIATVQTMLYLQRNREAGMTAELSDLRQTLNVARQHNSELTDQVQLVRLLTGSSKQITLEGKGNPKPSAELSGTTIAKPGTSVPSTSNNSPKTKATSSGSKRPTATKSPPPEPSNPTNTATPTSS
jgi:hypothetical protein